MAKVIGVRFQRAGKVSYYDPGDLEVRLLDHVVVETDNGLELAWVVISPDQVVYSEVKEPLKPVLRKATEEDLQRGEDLRAKAATALATTKELANSLNVPMRITDAAYTLDGGRLVVQYTAEGRVDFRELLHQTVRQLRVKVQLRQIGPRDEAKVLGGLGRCGQVLCCARWLTVFSPITMKMAKEQSLPLGAENLAGQCGRLRCCLRYEYEQYVSMNKDLPRIGEWVMSPHGRAKVIVGHPLKNAVSILLESQAMVEIPISDITRLGRN
ncbi:MAG: stage 0 sporulation family protein [Chloroflexi bacterium]|nr:stage 0 sporulation family protein [Chloroflexota bacterium]